MNKNRLEALSDGVFSIVMTILVFNVTVPALIGVPSDQTLLAAILKLWPTLLSYFVSFAVLTMFWIGHNFYWSVFTKEINRKLVLLNMLYLSILALIPFSTRLLGQFDDVRIAVVLYGVNVLLIGILSNVLLVYAIYSDEIDISHVETRLLNQARIRNLITPLFTMLGIISAYFSTPLALVLYTFPIFFNLVPGTLNFLERVFKFNL
jgi:uncharacterized membrane protein